MYVPTRLRVLRIKYKITLKALAGRMNISNQHLSRMELADIPPTEYHEHLICLGMERLLAEWDDSLTRWLKGWWAWHCRRRMMFFRGVVTA